MFITHTYVKMLIESCWSLQSQNIIISEYQIFISVIKLFIKFVAME